MSLDSSLKTGGGLVKHRNVLTRAERIEKLASTGKFDMAGDDPLGLVKVANRKLVTAAKTKKAPGAAEGTEGAEGAEGAAAEPTSDGAAKKS